MRRWLSLTLAITCSGERPTAALRAADESPAVRNGPDNVGKAIVIITEHPGRAGYGPLKNAPHNSSAEDEIDHKGK